MGNSVDHKDDELTALVTPAHPRRRGVAARCGGVACAVGALGTFAATADAATWSVIQRAAVPVTSEIGGAHLAFGGDGSALVDWAVAPPAPATSIQSGVARRAPDGTLDTGTLLRWSIATAPVVAADGRGLIVGGQAFNDWTFRGLGWASTEAGTVGRYHVLTTARLPIQPSLSMNARGDAIAAWVERRGAGVRVRAALRPSGKGFRKPFTVVDDPHTSWNLDGLSIAVTTAVGGDGRVAVAYSGRPRDIPKSALRVYAWAGSARAGLGRRMVVGKHQGYASLGAAVTTDHRVIVAWGSQSGGIEAGSPWVVRTASLDRGASRFGSVQVLDRGDKKEFSHSPVIVATGPRRAALIGWGSATFFDGLVRVASSSGSRFTKYREIAGSGNLSSLVAGKDGTAALSWTTLSSTPVLPVTWPPNPRQNYMVGAAVRASGSSEFGSAETVGMFVSTDLVSHYRPWLGGLAINPKTGQPAMAMVVPGADGAPPALEVRER